MCRKFPGWTPAAWRSMAWHDQRLIIEGMEQEDRDAETVRAWREKNAARERRGLAPLPPPKLGQKPTAHAIEKPVASTEYPTQLPAGDDLTAPARAKDSPFAVRQVVYSGPIPASQDETRAAIRRDAEKAIAAARGE